MTKIIATQAGYHGAPPSGAHAIGMFTKATNSAPGIYARDYDPVAKIGHSSGAYMALQR